MRAFLLASCPIAVWIVTAVHALLLILSLRAWARGRRPLHLLTALIVFGLFYDALILSLGGVLTEGPLLTALSRLRFVLHGALIPLIFMICAYALDLRGGLLRGAWIFTALLIVLGAAEGFAVELAAQNVAGIVRFSSGDATPAWAQVVSGILSYGTVVPLMIVGVVVWIKQKTPRLFLAGFLMFLFSALGPATGNFDLIFYISMFGEVCMALFFLLYADKKEEAEK